MAGDHQEDQRLELIASAFTHVGHDLNNALSYLDSLIQLLLHDARRTIPEELRAEFEETATSLPHALDALARVGRYLILGSSAARLNSRTKIDALVAEFLKMENRIEVTSGCPNLETIFPPAVLWAMLHEVSFNATKHGQATRMAVSWYHEGDFAVLVIEDNGCGFAQLRGDLDQPCNLFGHDGGGLLYWDRALLRAGGAIFVGRSTDLGGSKVILRIPGATSDASLERQEAE